MKYDKKEVFESIITKATSLSPEKKEEARAWLLSKIREKKTLKNGKERLLTTQQIQSEFYKTFFPQIPKNNKAAEDYREKRDKVLNEIEELVRAKL